MKSMSMPVGTKSLELGQSRIVFQDRDKARPVNLTRREGEVLLLLCDGLPNKLISRELKISLSTVKIHIGNVMRKLNVTSRLQVVVAATRHGVLAQTMLEATDGKDAVATRLPTVTAFEIDQSSQRFAA